jgi:putative PIN family toxin of toxin-antitoxin system
VRVVVDTSVWVSAILNPDGFPARVVAAFLEGRFTLIVSEPLLRELATTLAKPRIVRKYSIAPHSVAALLDAFRERAVQVPVHRTVRVCRDPDDDVVVETALRGRADVLVSRDDDPKGDPEFVRYLGTIGVQSMSVSRFLDALDRQSL